MLPRIYMFQVKERGHCYIYDYKVEIIIIYGGTISRFQETLPQ